MKFPENIDRFIFGFASTCRRLDDAKVTSSRFDAVGQGSDPNGGILLFLDSSNTIKLVEEVSEKNIQKYLRNPLNFLRII